MNTGLVVDASVLLAIIRSEPEGDVLAQMLEQRRRAGVTLLAPTGLWLEIINALVRRYRTTSDRVLQAVREIDALGIRAVEVGRALLVLTVDLTERHGLTAYDASYLAVAIAANTDLLTLDRELAYAAGERAVALDGQSRIHEVPAAYEHDVTWPRYPEAAAYLERLRAEAVAGRR